MLFRRFPWKKIHVRSIAMSVKTSRKTQTRAAAKASKSLLLSFLFPYFISAAALLLLKDIFSLFLYLLLNWKLNTTNIRAPAVHNFHCNKYSATSFALLLLSLFIMMTMRVTKEMSMYKKVGTTPLDFDMHACMHPLLLLLSHIILIISNNITSSSSSSSSSHVKLGLSQLSRVQNRGSIKYSSMTASSSLIVSLPNHLTSSGWFYVCIILIIMIIITIIASQHHHQFNSSSPYSHIKYFIQFVRHIHNITSSVNEKK